MVIDYLIFDGALNDQIYLKFLQTYLQKPILSNLENIDLDIRLKI